MKKILLSAALLSFLFTACKKSDDDNSGGIPSGQFSIGSNTYSNVFLTTGTGITLSAVSPTGGNLQMKFQNFTLPTTSGTYKVVVEPDASDEIQIIAASLVGTTSKVYTAGYVAGQTATVSVNDGKYTVQFNNVTARNQNDSTESVQVSANISEN